MDYKKFETFKFWFIYDRLDHWKIIEKETSTVIGDVSKSGTIVFYSDIENTSILNDDKYIDADWEAYQARPEYLIGQHVEISGKDSDVVKNCYSNLISSLIMCRAYKNKQNPDDHIDYIEKVVSWIASTDFYDMPASTRYHESFKHGLLYHTIAVYNNMLELIQIPKFKSVDIDSATLCCLVHDWCKIGLYESYKRNVKNEETGKWEQVDSYRRKSFPHPFGHGASSMYMAMKLFRLTEEEALAIRWHMSMFNVASNEINEYQQSCEEYPLVHLLQFSDQLSITNY